MVPLASLRSLRGTCLWYRSQALEAPCCDLVVCIFTSVSPPCDSNHQICWSVEHWGTIKIDSLNTVFRRYPQVKQTPSVLIFRTPSQQSLMGVRRKLLFVPWYSHQALLSNRNFSGPSWMPFWELLSSGHEGSDILRCLERFDTPQARGSLCPLPLNLGRSLRLPQWTGYS